MIEGLSVGLALPCLNEAAALAVMLPQVPEGIDEVVVADNESTDATAEVARHHGARVVPASPRGYGTACRTGLLAVSCDVAAILDADNTYPLQAIPSLVKTLKDENLDFITAARHRMIPWRSPESMVRRLGERVLAGAIVLSTGVSLADSQSGMWLVRREVLPLILPQTGEMSFSQEIKVRALTHPQVRAREVPVPFPNLPRTGKSKLKLFEDGLGNLTAALALGQTLRKNGTP